MTQATAVTQYRPMTLVELAGYLAGAADDSLRWRLVIEFLKEYRHEPLEVRLKLLDEEPETTGDRRWDVLLAALAEHLAAEDGRSAPPWAESRRLRQFWFPFNTRAARVDAIVHAPAAFRRRGVFVPAHGLDVAWVACRRCLIGVPSKRRSDGSAIDWPGAG